jgi:hypothetical protein
MPNPSKPLCLLFVIPLCLSAQEPQPQQSLAKLPIKRIVLYKNGLGYFEHLGSVRDRQDIIVEHPVRNGYELRGDARPVESTNAWQRFRLAVPARQTSVLVVEEARPLQTSYALTSLTAGQVALFLTQKSIDREIETALRRILTQKDTLGAIQAKYDGLEQESSDIFDDQQRLRENMKALKGSAEEKALLQRYTRQLNDQEDRLEALKKESKQVEAQKDAAQAELDRMIQEVSMDVKL